MKNIFKNLSLATSVVVMVAIIGGSFGIRAALADRTPLPQAANISGVVKIVNGGTNNSSAYTTGGVIYSNGTSLTQDVGATPGGFYWDATNHRLGIGTSTPQVGLDIYRADQSTIYAAGTFSGLRATIDNANTTNNTFAEWAMSTISSNGAFTTATRLVSIFTSHTANAVSADLAIVNRNAGTMVEDARFAANGHVGVATTTPWGLFNIAGKTSDTAPLFTVSTSTATATSTAFIITNPGNVGIGTTTPIGQLHVDNRPLGLGAVATTTYTVGDIGTTTSRACFNTKNAAGSDVSWYISAANAMVIETHLCN